MLFYTKDKYLKEINKASDLHSWKNIAITTIKDQTSNKFIYSKYSY